MSEKFNKNRQGYRWSADENKYLLELWYDQEPISEIADTLDRSEFDIICQLPWKAEVTLSRILSEIIENKPLVEQVKTFYLADYPNLVDIDVDEKQFIQAQKKREKERALKREKVSNLIREIEIKDISSAKSGLEELVVKVFSTLNMKTLSLLEIKERLVWIQGLALLFPIVEYDVLFSVYPVDGSKKKTYKQVSNELDIPKHQVATFTRNALKRLIMMISLLGEDRSKYTPWIGMNKFTYANMTLDNPKIVFPEVNLNYENIPKILNLVDDFEISNQEVKTLHDANIFCLGNLLDYEYEDLRFELMLDSAVARKVYSIKESYLKGEEDARRI